MSSKASKVSNNNVSNSVVSNTNGQNTVPSKTLAQNLKDAQEAIDSTESVKPDAKELEAIKKYCNYEAKRKQETEDLANQIKDLRSKQKQYKEKITEHMQRVKCYVVPRNLVTTYEKEIAKEGFPSMPIFVRMVPANKDSGITPEVIQEALETLTLEDIQEQQKDSPLEAVKEAVLTNVKRVIRTFTETMRQSTFLPKGFNIYEIPEASTELSELLYHYWITDCRIKKLLDAKKPDSSEKNDQKVLKSKIEEYFVRTGLTAQRITVEGRPYRLVRRVSMRKTKIGLTRFEAFLDEALEDLTFETFRPNDLIRTLQTQLASVPPESKSDIKLCAVRVAQEE